MSEQKSANDIDAALFDYADRCRSMAAKHSAAEKAIIPDLTER